MTIALMTDIHSNREAFEACLAHAAEHGAEQFVFLGDFVGYGADPEWVLDTLIDHVARGAIALLGNHDAAALGTLPGRLNAGAQYCIEWTRPRLNAAHVDFLSQLPLSAERRWLALPGSVGQPRDGNPAACYAMFDELTSLLTYWRVPYDHEQAARKVLEA